MKKYVYLNVVLIVILTTGCTSWQKKYGTLKSLPKGESKLIIQDLIDRWRDFDIYYYDSKIPYSVGIMFDPKNNDTALLGDTWKKITKEETLLNTVKWIRHDLFLRKIIGPDGRLYGYIYNSYGHVTLKMIDDKKMYVFSLEMKGGN